MASETAVAELVRHWPESGYCRYFHRERGLALLARMNVSINDLLAALDSPAKADGDKMSYCRLWEAASIADPQRAADAFLQP